MGKAKSFYSNPQLQSISLRARFSILSHLLHQLLIVVLTPLGMFHRRSIQLCDTINLILSLDTKMDQY